MRDWSVRALFVLLAASCGTAPAVTVVRTSAGDKIEAVTGDSLKLKRGAQEGFSGAKGGYYVIRGQDDWQRAWPSDKAPPMPATLDTGRQMLFLAVAETNDVSHVKVQRVLETGSYLYVWVHETKLGQSCPNKAQEHAFDAVITSRNDKPVKFYVEDEQGESCGEAPVASVQCRLANQPTWSTKLTAQPGDNLECLMSAETRGKFALVDKVLSMSELPAGSTAKLAFRKGPDRAELELDVYGTYTVHAEAADEAGRRGKGTATIEVAPPKTKDVLVQLVWAGFDLRDESDTFPRVNLRVAEEGPKGQRCSAGGPIPGLCDVKTRGAYTYMRIPEGNRKLPISVQYIDERYEKGPGPCVHVWYDGARTAETCDRKQRSSDEIWKVGVLDTSSGALAIEGAPPPTTAADAGAPAPAKN
jgi:hypothetical protein